MLCGVVVPQDVMDGTSAPAAAGGASKLPSSTELEHETVLLLTRWQCLLEERKQLTAAMQRAYRTGVSANPAAV
jgi:hypothetical protein